ncbi:uncharacterized protein LOC133038495 [Cannabis sativa]|uniref:uncharacterized protein LOC133038495 n=1 Tax=Cannabis sativa TaxID=3483 RepID=UPI0029C9C655|nr:uncharacterized protein LOC133038495 [Cannabis sativa]
MDCTNILSWHVRGMNKRDKQGDILSLLNLNKVGVSALIKNKLKNNKVDEMMVKVFHRWDYHRGDQCERRILVAWLKSFVQVKVLKDHKQLVHCLVKFIGSQLEVFVTFVYGFNTIDERVDLWKELSLINCQGVPWLIAGDFNAVFCYGDRTGYRAVTPSELVDATAWIAQSKLEALKISGSKFTWSNKQDGKDRVYSKIDHAFINEDWIDSMPNSLAVFQWETCSDQCYCVIKTQQQGVLGIKPFRFFNLWTSHSKFQEVVSINWNKPMAGSRLHRIFRKLLRLKHVLKRFNRMEIGDVEQKYHQAKADYQCALTNAQEDPTDECAQLQERNAAAMFQQQAAMYQSFLIQRSKITWLSKGDENTAFFHACIKKRRQENMIVSFINEDGETVEDYEQVVNHFVSHFKHYMGSKSSRSIKIDERCMEMGPRLSMELQLNLIKKFSKEDVRKAIFSIASTKSPGANGYNFEFFKAMWKLIGDEIAEVVHDFF